MQKNIINSKTRINYIAAALLVAFVLSTPFAAQAAKDTSKQNITPVNSSCIQTAVEKREGALMEAFKGFSDAIMAALTQRKSALNEAWGMAEGSDRKSAIKNTWTEWKADKKAAHAELKTDRKMAWDAFKTTVKSSCKIEVPKEEGLERDSSGSLSL